MKKLIVLSITLIYTVSAVSQSLGVTKAVGERNFRDISNQYYDRSNQILNIEDVEGQPYLDKSFTSGYIINTKSGQKAKTFLRYNVYKDIFEIKFELSSNEIKTLERGFNFQYQLNNETFVLVESPQAINQLHYQVGNGYLAELTDSKNKATLYKRYFIELRPEKKAKTSFEEDKPAEFELSTRYIIKFGDNYVKAENHRKKILDAFPDHKKEMKKYINDKKFKFRGSEKEVQNQMIQVVRYYNSLGN